MWIAMFTSSSYPCVGVVADVICGVGVDMLSDIEIIVMATPAITLEVVVGGACADVLTVAIVDVVSAIDVDMLANENANGLAAVTTPLEFILPSP